MKTHVIAKDSLILIDWLTFSTKIWSESEIIQLLQLQDVTWEHIDAYRYGYRHRCSFGGISILSDGYSEDMGICIDISGQGCRSFEDFSSLSWIDLFKILLEPLNEFNITHIDLAFDDHTGILDIGQLLDDTDDHWYRSRSRWWKVEYGSTGTTIYHGSPKSNIRTRIYDKAAERGLLDDTHWIRVELVLREENAVGAARAIIDKNDIGPVFSGILCNYLVYCEPSEDSNRSRWPVAEYWQKLIDSVAAIHIASKPGTEYNVFRLRHTILQQYSGAIYTWIQLYGIEGLEDLLKQRRSPLNPNHKRLLMLYEKWKAGEISAEDL